MPELQICRQKAYTTKVSAKQLRQLVGMSEDTIPQSSSYRNESGYWPSVPMLRVSPEITNIIDFPSRLQSTKQTSMSQNSYFPRQACWRARRPTSSPSHNKIWTTHSSQRRRPSNPCSPSKSLDAQVHILSISDSIRQAIQQYKDWSVRNSSLRYAVDNLVARIRSTQSGSYHRERYLRI